MWGNTSAHIAICVSVHRCPELIESFPFQSVIKDDRPTWGLLPTIFVLMLHLYIITNQHRAWSYPLKETGMFDLNVLHSLWIFKWGLSFEAAPRSPFVSEAALFFVTYAKWSFNLEGNHKEDFRDFRNPLLCGSCFGNNNNFFFFLWIDQNRP